MPAVDLFGPAAKDAQARPSATVRLVNCFREAGERGPRLRQAPGMRRFVALDGLFLRAMERIGGDLHVIHGGQLRRIASSGAVTDLGEIPDSATTCLAGLNGKLVITANGRFYRVDEEGETEQPAAGAFSAFGSVAVVGQRAVLSERGGRRFQWSPPDDPDTLDGLSFSTAEQRDDLNVRGLEVAGEYWLFKDTSIERWGLTGAPNEQDAFAYIGGSLIPVGIDGFHSVTPIPSGVFFIGADGRAYLGAPGALRPVSTVAVETVLAEATVHRTFHTRYEGHEFCVVTFKDRPAWCLDVATGEWWERAQGEALGPWQAVAAADVWSRQLVGMDDGRLLWLEQWPSDDDEPIHRRAVSKTVDFAGRGFRVSRLELTGDVGREAVDDLAGRGPAGLRAGSGALEADTGYGLQADDGYTRREPQVLLRLSRDRGATWSDWMPRTLGDRGRHETRLIWRALGWCPASLTVEAACAEPLDVTLDAGAWVEVA